MRLRALLILPATYAFLMFVFMASCFLSLGHWGGCSFAYYLLFPAAFFLPEMYPIGMFVAIALNILAYACLGYVVDRLRLGRKR